MAAIHPSLIASAWQNLLQVYFRACEISQSVSHSLLRILRAHTLLSQQYER